MQPALLTANPKIGHAASQDMRSRLFIEPTSATVSAALDRLINAGTIKVQDNERGDVERFRTGGGNNCY